MVEASPMSIFSAWNSTYAFFANSKVWPALRCHCDRTALFMGLQLVVAKVKCC